MTLMGMTFFMFGPKFDRVCSGPSGAAHQPYIMVVLVISCSSIVIAFIRRLPTACFDRGHIQGPINRACFGANICMCGEGLPGGVFGVFFGERKGYPTVSRFSAVFGGK